MKIAIGIDTSNYTTSCGAVDWDGNVTGDSRRLLSVKEGERGLRQSDALFQHIKELPGVLSGLMKSIKEYEEKSGQACSIAAVGVSTRPRPIEGSYMPVFLAGVSAASALAQGAGVKLYEFSHQEGHIAAVTSDIDREGDFLSFHLSGGTGELLRVRGCMPLKICGGSEGLSFGQLLDRTGVMAGLKFPAGAELDRLALENRGLAAMSISRKGRIIIEDPLLKPVFTRGAGADLSGTETQCMKALKDGASIERLAPELFYRICQALCDIISFAAEEEKLNRVLLAGGVASSSFIRQELAPMLKRKNIEAEFGQPALSSDNACGIARLAMAAYRKDIKD